MRSRILLVAVLSATLAAVAAQSQTPRASANRDSAQAVTETKHLKITTSSSASTLAAGGRVQLFVSVEPKPRMHVYAPEQNDYIPISLTLAAHTAIRAERVQFPKGEKFFFEPLKETQIVYSKPFRITQPVTLSSSAAGPVTIKGTVRYQACDDAICYLPQEVGVSWTVTVKP